MNRIIENIMLTLIFSGIALLIAALIFAVVSAVRAASGEILVGETVTLPDGRHIECVRHSQATSKSGISCDWQSRQPQPREGEPK